MAILKAFKAWRPHPTYVSEIACLPYDVVHTEDARRILENNPESFMKVVRPEADFDTTISTYDDAVYQKGRDNLESFLASEKFVQDNNTALYIYRLRWHDKVKTGVVGAVSVQDYDNGIILKHELTRPDKENDRTRHIVSQQAHSEPVMMTFKSNSTLQKLISEQTQREPIYKFYVEDEVEHSIWKVDDPTHIIEEFSAISRFYIADGHHRCASASRAAKEVNISEHPNAGYFPAVLFPINEVQILAYNRIIYHVPENFIADLEKEFILEKDVEPVPSEPGDIRFYYNQKWYGIKLPESNHSDIESQLDIARLQEFILEPFFGISDQRIDKNISFVGGVHGIEELEYRVNSGEAELAISMFPTSIKELVDVSDAGLLMPPKSTWFEPKLRSGLVIHTF